ncbi:MAG: zincin-like metallopeptidase domain-containing protein [Hyphomicrobiaceae bacterium]
MFNCAEVEGFTPPDAPERLGPIARIAAADRFIAATGARIAHGGERAFYAPSTDHIQMPDEALFCGTDTMDRDESYFAVLLHELTHYADIRIMPRGTENGLKHGAYCPLTPA